MQWLNSKGRSVKFSFDPMDELWVVTDIMGNKGNGETLTDAVLSLRLAANAAARELLETAPPAKKDAKVQVCVGTLDDIESEFMNDAGM